MEIRNKLARSKDKISIIEEKETLLFATIAIFWHLNIESGGIRGQQAISNRNHY